MNVALLSYDKNTDNIGDYIQSIATSKLIGTHDYLIDREKLNSYDGKLSKMVLNGWFMSHPENWPPSDKIIPLFISFHINPTAKNKMLNEKGIKYLKRYAPIGCRDYYTLSILHENNIDAYFSGCNTLTLKREDFVSHSQPRQGIIICGVLDRIIIQRNWNIRPIKKLLDHNCTAFLKYPSQKIRHVIGLNTFNKFLKTLNEPVSTINQIVNLSNKTEKERFEIAQKFLMKIASAKLVITSRIHTALPAVALGTPVIFIEDGLEHINQFSRLLGLNRFFYHTSIKNLANINLDEFSNPNNHLSFVEDIEMRIRDFIF